MVSELCAVKSGEEEAAEFNPKNGIIGGRGKDHEDAGGGCDHQHQRDIGNYEGTRVLDAGREQQNGGVALVSGIGERSSCYIGDNTTTIASIAIRRDDVA